MTLTIRAVTLLALLGCNAAMALSGSDALICDLLEYSEDPQEVSQATAEASKRGICGYAKIAPQAAPVENAKGKQKADREKRGKAVLIGGAIVCIAKGKCEQTLTSPGK